MNNWLYHPSTVVFVDDQKCFLAALQRHFPQHFHAQFFSDPIEALEAIENHCSLSHKDLLFNIKNEQLVEFDLMSDGYIGLQIDKIRNIASNPQRYSEPTVVVVERMMPELDGVEFCRLLKNHPIKKIMLSAHSDRLAAVDAFNEGVIDYFILKSAPDLVQQLTYAIEKMQVDYFDSLLPRQFGNTLKTINPHSANPHMNSFYQKWMKNLHASEMYLLDQYGSVLFITDKKRPITLAISHETTLDLFADIAKDQEEFEIASLLLKREKLVFFPNKLDSMQPVIKWTSFLFTANPIPGQKGCFYSLIEDPKLQPLNNRKIKLQ